MKLKTLRNIFILLSLLFLAFGSGYRAGQENLFSSVGDRNRNIELKQPVDFSLFWDVWERLNRLYIDKKALIPQKMIYGAISGLVSSLEDPYTVFLPPDQNKEAKDDLKGQFEGIGAQLGVKDKKIMVIAPLKGSPAEKAGILAGDVILKVNGEEAVNWSLPAAVAKIRGPKGTEVVLTVLHKEASEPVEIKVKRDTILVAAVEWKIGQVFCRQQEKEKETYCDFSPSDCFSCHKIAYLKLSRFGDQTAEEWNKAVAEIKKTSSLKGLILDLRNNPGGYLNGAVYTASEFIKEGVIVVQESVKSGRREYKVERAGKLTEIPMVVIINKGSASASEILAGALQEYKRAKVVGEKSFGKGSVQEAQDLAGGAGLHITVAKWLLPSGKWINSTGVEPEVKVVNDEKNPDLDLQLSKAIELLINQ